MSSSEEPMTSINGMSEADTSRQPVNRPGTSCLGCRRRKLKCTREPEGCHNCTKSDLPCVYPAPDVGVKRKRGPYKKDKPPRQRHLEDLVKYLEPKDSPNGSGALEDAESACYASTSPRPSGHGSSVTVDATKIVRSLGQNGANSEELVRDALIALTRSSVTDQEARADDGAYLSQDQSAVQERSASHHPSVRRILEYWHTFNTRVDPITKILHCPSFSQRLFGCIDHLQHIPQSTEALLFSIYYAAVATCTARECRKRFGESQDTLIKRYGRAFEAALGDNYDTPALETVQALVLYITVVRRSDESSNVRALFSLAVRSAQIIGLHEDPGERFSPFESELRRRLVYHLYGLESRSAEESNARSTSIMQNRNKHHDKENGVTDMTFSLLRFEIHCLVYGLWSIRKQRNNSSAALPVQEDQMNFWQESRARLDALYLAHMDSSRPYDLMCMMFVEGMLIKAHLVIDFPFQKIPTKTMPTEERMSLLRSSVDIIRGTHMLAVDKRFSDWLWFFRSMTQWHSLGIVVAELNFSTNPQFVDAAWQVLDPILAGWDTIYKAKKEEPAWEHVNSLIERARYMRHQRSQHYHNGTHHQNGTHSNCPPNASRGPPLAQQKSSSFQTSVPIHDRRSPYPAYLSPPVDATHNHHPHQQPAESNTNSLLTPANSCAGTGSIMNFDVNYASFEGLENIDFSAFDQVFGGGGYDFVDPLGEVDLSTDGGMSVEGFVGHAGR